MRYWLYVAVWIVLAAFSAKAQEGALSVPSLDEINMEDFIDDSNIDKGSEDVSAPVSDVLETAEPDNTGIEADNMLPMENKQETLAPQISQQGLENHSAEVDSEAETETGAEAETEKEPDIETVYEVQFDVFEPDFMNSLMKCQPNQESRNGVTLQIIGIKDEKCQLTYGNYELNLPKNILNNIHGFDDLPTLLKNSDFAQYKYSPEYIYDGVIYTLEACAKQEEYMGVEEEEKLVDAVVTRGVSAEYQNEECIVHLQNELDLNGDYYDYGVVCRFPQSTIDELMPYFEDIIKKYPQSEVLSEDRPKELKDADVALMYYLQQNEYCHQNRSNWKQ